VKSTVDEAWQFSTTSPDTQSYLANEGIELSFIIELPPWMGGFYERLVGLVKQSFRKSSGKICLNIVQLETILTAVEAVVSSRPLWKLIWTLDLHLLRETSYALIQNLVYPP
jgi:hypothetical protein